MVDSGSVAAPLASSRVRRAHREDASDAANGTDKGKTETGMESVSRKTDSVAVV